MAIPLNTKIKKVRKFIYLLCILLFITTSCNTAKDASKEDICGRYTSSTPDSMTEGISRDSGTTLKCDGTFESGLVSRVEGYNSVDRAYFTGTWSVVEEIPAEVIQAVIEFGLNHDDYSIIKYSSSNGIEGYCLYNYYSPYYSIEPLYLGQVSRREYGNVSGALGIFGGFKE